MCVQHMIMLKLYVNHVFMRLDHGNFVCTVEKSKMHSII